MTVGKVLVEEQKINFKLLAEEISLLNDKSDRIEGKIDEVDSNLKHLIEFLYKQHDRRIEFLEQVVFKKTGTN